jgi:hypothetical protein
MRNWVDTAALITVGIGTICGFCAPHAHKAGIVVSLGFGAGGFALGLASAKIFSGLAYWSLRSHRLKGVMRLMFYSVCPLMGMFSAGVVPVLVADLVWGRK